VSAPDDDADTIVVDFGNITAKEWPYRPCPYCHVLMDTKAEMSRHLVAAHGYGWNARHARRVRPS